MKLTCTTPDCSEDFVGGSTDGSRWCKHHGPGAPVTSVTSVAPAKSSRPDKDRYYMEIARAVSARGTCSRAKVGAVIVVGDVIASTGYNGAPRGARHCDHANGGDMEDGHCSRAVHGETNAIANASRHGAIILNGVLYVTATPCYRCAPLVIQAGISRIVIGAEYRPDPRALALLKECGVEISAL